MTHLFDPFQQRAVTFRNRIGVSPMCQYSSHEGFANDWHLVHLVSRAVGGAGLVITEAAAVEPQGRISPRDLGIWSDEHLVMLSKIVTLIQEAGAIAGIQIAHAGRKAGCAEPWKGGKSLAATPDGWQPIAPSAIAFSETSPVPTALSLEGIDAIKNAFIQAAQRALLAGFQVIEIHAAHGYLLHEFLSPLSNYRTDHYGGSFDGRIRLLLEITQSVRAIVPDRLPLWVRISATDWSEGGWDLEQSIALSRALKSVGVDLIDCSSGGLIPQAQIPIAPGYQIDFSDRIRQETEIATAAVGLITTPTQAEEIIHQGQADLVLLGRELLRDPYWPHRAAKILGVNHHNYPNQYLRAW